MQKKSSISSLLGVTQHEMASLLHISRSQWSMYELGRGSLPRAATLLLAELLTFVKASEKAGKTRPQVAQQKVMRQQLERLLLENEFQQVLTTKKIIIAEKKHATQMQVLPLISVLGKQANSKTPAAAELLTIVGNRTSELKEAEASVALFKLQAKQKLLEFEKELLETKLQELAILSES